MRRWIMSKKRDPDFYEQQIAISEEQIKKAEKRLKDNLKKEAKEVDPRLMFLKLKKAFVEQYGRINACNTKANDIEYTSIVNRNRIQSLEKKNKDLEEHLNVQKRVIQDALEILRKKTTPWYERIWKKIVS